MWKRNISQYSSIVDPFFGFVTWVTADPSRTKASNLGCSEDKLDYDTAASSPARSDLVPWYEWPFLESESGFGTFFWEKNSVVSPPRTRLAI